MLHIRNPKDFWTGTLYLAVGAVVLWIARAYPMGSAGRMGPGYFPVALSVLLMGLGAFVLFKGISRDGAPFGEFAWRGTALVLASTVAFGLLLERAGLIIALIVLIGGSALASAKSEYNWKTALCAVGLIAFCVVTFVKGLGVVMPLYGSWFGG